jgi:hypothetical protein
MRHLRQALDGIGKDERHLRWSAGEVPAARRLPAIGHWTAAEVAAADAPLRAAGTGVTGKVRTVAEWVAYATGRSQGIIGFYH